MAQRMIHEGVTELAEAAARLVIADLRQAIAEHGQAVWVIAGGSSPVAAYRWLGQHGLDALDWSKVTIIIGDERCVPFSSQESNWTQAEQVFLHAVNFSELSVRPQTDGPAESAAEAYEAWLQRLPHDAAGRPRLDVLWLGVGEDGHMLSLFPGHPSTTDQTNDDRLVIAVHDSPKPPPDRISLTFRALQGAVRCAVLAAGSGKSAVISRAVNGDQSLPVAQAVATVEAAGGHVSWLLDRAAASQL